MHWLVIGVWIGVLAFALVVLGFCAFELIWKAKRLQRDLAGFAELGAKAQQLRIEVIATQERLARTTSD